MARPARGSPATTWANGQDGLEDAGSGTVIDENLVGVDPLFADESAHDFHLTGASPAIDAAPDMPGVTKDFDGRDRPQTDGWDFGAFEWAP